MKITQKIKKLIYTVRHSYMTLQNVVVAVALLIAANWMWGALEMMQRNYALQKEVDAMRRELVLTELQRDSLELQKRYLQTDEYRELAVRESMGLVMPGEKKLILADNGIQEDGTTTQGVSVAAAADSGSNIEQWLNFLFGGNSSRISSSEND